MEGARGKMAAMLHNSLDEMMQEYAERATELARDFNATLDYSGESVEALERILAQLSDEHRAFMGAQARARGADSAAAGDDKGGRATAGAVRDEGHEQSVDEQMVVMCKLWGGYLGEVVRRRWGGEWAMETYPGASFATLTLNVRGAKLFPSMKIYRRLTEGAGDDVWKFYQTVAAKLEAAPKTP